MAGRFGSNKILYSASNRCYRLELGLKFCFISTPFSSGRNCMHSAGSVACIVGPFRYLH
jgi:hypothetical protein